MPILRFALALTLFSAVHATAAEKVILVESGSTDRTNVIIRLDGEYTGAEIGNLTGFGNKDIPIQGGTFILPTLKAGETLSLKLKQKTSEQNPKEQSPQATEVNQKVTFNAGHTPLLVYQGRESELPRPEIKPLFKRGGYIHPVYSPSGRIVTDDYPPNHIHHHGIWMPWTKTEFEGRSPDFWNMGEGKGKVEFLRLQSQWSGPVHASVRSEHRFVDLTSGQPKPALNETWTITSYGIVQGSISANIFDLESVQTTASASPLKLPKYYYGGLGFRGNWAWNGKDKTYFLSSDGTTNRVTGNEKRANWVYIGGELDGQQTGVAILCHPKNFRAPQPMRWHPTEPFFCYAPSQLGDWEIKPGVAYISSYRFVVFDGPPNPEWIEAIYQNYANPPRVKVETK